MRPEMEMRTDYFGLTGEALDFQPRSDDEINNSEQFLSVTDSLWLTV